MAFALLALACVGAFAVVAPTCQQTPLGIDEQVSFFLASGPDWEGVYRRTVRQAATPPLPFWLAHESMHRLPANGPMSKEFRLRLPTAIALPLSIMAAFLIACELGGWGAGAAAALLLSTHAEALYQATQARPYSLGIFLNLLAAWSAVAMVRKGPSWSTQITLLAANVALLWTHLLFASCLIGQAVLVCSVRARSLQSSRTSMAERRWLALGLIGASALALAPLASMVLRLHTHSELLNWITERRPWWRQLELAPPWPCLAALSVAFLFGVLRRRSRASPASDRPFASWVETLGVFAWWLAPIYSLWFASQFAGPALAQPRYFVVQLGPMCIAGGILLARLAGQKPAILAALAFVVVDQAPARLLDYVGNPVRHDRHWQKAAELLSARAKPADLILVQTGLVESLLVPMQFASAEFQEYVCSRLSDFYLTVPAQRLSLPLRWSEGDWLGKYSKVVDQTIEQGNRIYVVVSADSDLGQAVANLTIRWLQTRGLQVESLSTEPVAMIWQARSRN